MLDRAVKYPDGWLPGVPGVRPLGIAKNATTIEAEDGAPFDKDYINDIDAVFQGAVLRRGIVPSGVPDTGAVSDVLDGFGFMFGITHATISDAIDDATLKVGMQISTANNISGTRGGAANYTIKTLQETIDDGDDQEFGFGNHESTGVPGLVLVVQPINGIYTAQTYGAGLGAANDTDALVALHAFADEIIYEPAVYNYDPTSLARGIPCKEGQKVTHLPGAVVKLIARTYAENVYYLGVSFGIDFPDDLNRYKGLKLYSLVFDGNSENVIMNAAKSSNAYWIWKQDNARVIDCRTINMPIGNGGLPALMGKFCKDLVIKDFVTVKEGTALYATDRQSISIIESTGYMEGGDLSNSTIREPVLVSTGTPLEWEKSEFNIYGGAFDNTGTKAGSRIIRYSGISDGIITGNVRLKSNKQNTDGFDIDGIFIGTPIGIALADRSHRVTIGDVHIDGPNRDINIQDDGLLKIIIDGVTSKNVDEALSSSDSYSNGTDVGWLKILSYNCECAVESFTIDGCENLFINQLRTDGGIIAGIISDYGDLTCSGVQIDNNAAPTYVFNVENQKDAYAVTFKNQPVITNCGGFGNTNDVMRFAGVSTGSGNAIAWLGDNNKFLTFVAGGIGSIPCTRNGFYWLWHDSTAVLRTKGGAPKADTEGTIVGTQT